MKGDLQVTKGKDLSKAFTGPQIRTIFGTLGPAPSRRADDPEILRIEAMDRIENIISRKFTVLESRYDQAGVYIKVNDHKDGLEDRFEYVRIKLKELNFFPRLVPQGKDLFIVSYPLPKRKKKGIRANVIMLILTIFTTVWAGSILWVTRSSEIGSLSDLLASLISPIDLLMGGLTFAFPLLLILGTHELGHYFTARRYRIDSSLPYFIPIPPFISPIGTFGALISMKEPLSTRKSLVDIGAAGPIAGFIVAIPITIIGLVLTDQYPVVSELVDGNTYMMINPPLLFQGLQNLLGVGNDGVLYPTAFAGWIGLFVTALNLLPVGQLDGGHIARGALGEKARFVSMGTLVIMVFLGLTTGFTTYIVFAVLILFLGARHPPPLDDITPLSKRQIFTTGLSVCIMVLTFHPVPLEVVEVRDRGLEIELDSTRYFVSPYVPNLETFEIENEGSGLDSVSIHISMDGEELLMSSTNISLDVDLRAYAVVLESNPSLFSNGEFYVLLLGPRQFDLTGGSTKGIHFIFGCSSGVRYGNYTDVELIVRSEGDKEGEKAHFKLLRARQFIESDVRIGDGSAVVDADIWMLDGQKGNSTVSVKFIQGPMIFQASFEALSGNWSELRSDIQADISTRYDVGNIIWSMEEGYGNASLRLVILPDEGRIAETEIQITILGPNGSSDDIELFMKRYH